MPWRFLDLWPGLACALSGVLLVASFAPISWSAAAWIALIPAWWALRVATPVERRPFRHGYLVGLIYFGGVFWWIGNVTVIGTVFLILYLALYPATWFWLVRRLIAPAAGQNPFLQAVSAAALWVMLEWWRSWFLTGFNWNELGVSQAPSLVYRQLAAYGGLPLLSFLLVFVNVLWAEAILALNEQFRAGQRTRLSAPLAGALVTVALGFALGWHHLGRHRTDPPGPMLTYACVQPNVPQIPFDGQSWARFQKTQQEALDLQVKLSIPALAAKPDLLVWPEAIIDQGIFQDRPLNEAVSGICRAFDGQFLLGSQDFEQKKLYNCAYLFSPGGDRFQQYYKTRLVILGEYLPFGDSSRGLHQALGMGIDFTPGTKPGRFLLERLAVSFAPLICFEDTLPEVTMAAARLGPDFFVTITNDGWYQGWTARWGVRQHLAHAVFRCVEHDRAMLRCANNGISCEIDANGTVVRRLHDAAGRDVDIGGVFSGTLQISPTHGTFYERAGDWMILLSSLIVVTLGVRFFLRRTT